jgi:hypothetical protein
MKIRNKTTIIKYLKIISYWNRNQVHKQGTNGFGNTQFWLECKTVRSDIDNPVGIIISQRHKDLKACSEYKILLVIFKFCQRH